MGRSECTLGVPRLLPVSAVSASPGSGSLASRKSEMLECREAGCPKTVAELAMISGKLNSSSKRDTRELLALGTVPQDEAVEGSGEALFLL